MKILTIKDVGIMNFRCMIASFLMLISITSNVTAEIPPDIRAKVAESVRNRFGIDISAHLAAQGLMDGINTQPNTPTILAANRVWFGGNNGTHAAYASYEDGTIITIIKDPTGAFSTGSQIISIGTTPVSLSTTYCFEVIGGVSYTVHMHEECVVYSTDYSQVVIFKQ